MEVRDGREVRSTCWRRSIRVVNVHPSVAVGDFNAWAVSPLPPRLRRSHKNSISEHRNGRGLGGIPGDRHLRHPLSLCQPRPRLFPHLNAQLQRNCWGKGYLKAFGVGTISAYPEEALWLWAPIRRRMLTTTSWAVGRQVRSSFSRLAVFLLRHISASWIRRGFWYIYLPIRHIPLLLRSRVFLMSSPPALQQLHRLNRSSPDFHDQLSNVLYGEEYKQWVANLQGDDLIWLVDYLDKVRRCVPLPHSSLILA